MTRATYDVDGFIWGHTTDDDEGYSVFEIISVPVDYPATEEMWALAYAQVTEVPLIEVAEGTLERTPGTMFQANIGLAGRSGGEVFIEDFGSFDEAARFAIQVLEEHFFAEDGKFHGVDAMR